MIAKLAVVSQDYVMVKTAAEILLRQRSKSSTHKHPFLVVTPSPIETTRAANAHRTQEQQQPKRVPQRTQQTTELAARRMSVDAHSPATPNNRKRTRAAAMQATDPAAQLPAAQTVEGAPPTATDDGFVVDNDATGSGEDDDDEGVTKPSDKKAGRRKIKIEFIQDKSRRHITFSKRKAGKSLRPTRPRRDFDVFLFCQLPPPTSSILPSPHFFLDFFRRRFRCVFFYA